MRSEIPDELSDNGSTDCALPPLRLNIDGVETQAILLDYSINTAITGPSNDAGCVLKTSSIAHRDQQLDNQPFKERGRDGSYSCEHFVYKRSIELTISRGNSFIWGQLGAKSVRRRHGIPTVV